MIDPIRAAPFKDGVNLLQTGGVGAIRRIGRFMLADHVPAIGVAHFRLGSSTAHVPIDTYKSTIGAFEPFGVGARNGTP